MREQTEVRGMVISQAPVGEWDRRVVILTMEKGKISVFAKGSKKPGSRLAGICQPMNFGTFSLSVGRNSYTLLSASMEHYFMELKADLEKIAYGSYFIELASRLTRENNDEREILKLLYETLRVLEKGRIPYALIRCIYEIRIFTCFGEGIQAFSCVGCQTEENLLYFSLEQGGCLCSHCRSHGGYALKLADSVLYTLQYIIAAPLEKLFRFLVSKEVLKQLELIGGKYLFFHIKGKLKSLEILESITADKTKRER